jgi:Domain of unknown function (DUF1476).
MLFDRKTVRTRKSNPFAAETRAQVHRDRMAGLWAAELLGLLGHAAHDYAREVAHAPRAAAQPEEEAGEDDEAREEEPVMRRLSRDLHGRVCAQEIREKLGHLLAEARRRTGGEKRDA